jgi:hypothetical protein
LPSIATFSGRSAAWLHGIDVDPDPIEVTVPKGLGVSARSGLAVKRATLFESDVVIVHGYRATSMLRTLRDLSSRLSVTEAVVIVDMALHAGIVDVTTLHDYAAECSRRRGVINFRRVVSLAEPATESPMESRLRMLLVLGGLPRPQAQTPLMDRHGLFLGRPDLYYPEHRLGIEYDGASHRDRLAEDNHRQNRLLSNGIRLLRFSAGDVLGTPDLVFAQVRNMLVGCSGH